MGCVYRRKGRTTYWIKYRRDGVAYYESSHSDNKDVAKRLLRRREYDIDRGVPVTPQLGKLTYGDASRFFSITRKRVTAIQRS